MSSDAATLVAVALSAARFIDCAYRLLGHGVAIHDGATTSRQDASHVLVQACDGFADELAAVRGQLRAWPLIVLPAECDDDPAALQTLARACAVVAGDLVLRLGQIQRGGRETAQIWCKEDVDGLASLLWELRTTLQLGIVSALRKADDVRALAASSHNNVDTFERDLLRAIAGDEELFRADLRPAHRATSHHDGTSSPNTASSAPAVQDADLRQDPNKASLLQEFILDGLSYASMKDREEEVAAAHRKTFEWIFKSAETTDGKQSSFLPWLKSSEQGGIYWVNGKAGSGKSTLMRFIYDHQTTRQELQVWAGSKPLTVAGFFFWTSGSLEQRSQSGLLRYLLYQLLDQHRDLIPVVFPDLWARCWVAKTQDRIKIVMSWSLADLINGLTLFLRHASARTKICLFIDGLDEFDGDHHHIISLFASIVTMAENDIKVCVSSRPWGVFEKAFEAIPSLKLQELTLGDMMAYATDGLTEDKRIRQIIDEYPASFPHLVDQVVTKADGVFLWVVLAVRYLRLDIDAAGGFEGLQERLDELPSDLDELFRYTLFQIQDADAVQEAAQIFQLIRAREVVCEFTRDESAASLLLWELALAVQADDEHYFLFEAGVQPDNDKEVLKRCRKMVSTIKERCAGLLQVNKNLRKQRDGPQFARESVFAPGKVLAEGKVTFLHRTVRDFLIYSHGLEYLEIQLKGTSFDPHLCHVQSYILQLKLPLEEPERHRRLDEWWPGIVLALTHARHMAPRPAAEHDCDLQTLLLDEINQTLSWYWLPRKTYGYSRREPGDAAQDTWARAAFNSFEVRSKTVFHDAFFSLAVKFGMATYVRDVVRRPGGGPVYVAGQPPLAYAVQFLLSRRQSVYPLSAPALVADLLAHGADPNQPYHDFAGRPESPWLRALKHVREGHRRGWIACYDTAADGTARWVAILRCFLQHGADPNAYIAKSMWDPAATALDVVNAVCERFASVAVDEVRQMLRDMGALTVEERDRQEETAVGVIHGI